ncbi:MAG: flagellar biosynthesis protein FlhA [Myxococcales bacterium]|nr:flagellar biosynthesis protein FlhA [Myxococcales bacterium]
MASAPTPSAPKEKLTEALVPLGIIVIVLMMVLPLPAMLLDAMLSFSIALGIGIFLTALFVEEALEFSAFPALVLVATLLRLSLNVATTRLILLHGAEGEGAAGSVVEAFGRFVVEGNVLVGLVVFLILVVINFVVVTKGAGRVAEVAARFTLDAMPGKQMAIDADLASGSVTAEQAKKRRRDLEREADFYGAMDGASKFVHGDAIAGLLITAINLIGGLILGVAAGLDVGKAAETFSVLTVGDALVSQIPALLVSAASGVVVTRSATGEQLGRALTAQIFGRRRPVIMTAGILAALGLMPGMPALPCLTLALVLFVAARRINETGGAVTEQTASETQRSPQEEIDAALTLDTLTLELGYELVPTVEVTRGGTLLDRVASLRSQFAKDLGVVVPPVHVADNLELSPGMYRVLILGSEIGRGTCRAGYLLAMDATGSAPAIDGEVTKDPAFGTPARWIHTRDRELAEALGYTVLDHSTVIATHLSELLRINAHRLLGRQETQHLFDILARTAPKLVDDLVPNLLPLGDVVRVLKNLLKESVSIRDLRSILEALSELSTQTKDPEQLTELVRERLAPQLTSAFRGSDGAVTALTLDPRVEDVLRRSLRDIAQGVGAPLSPELLHGIANAAEKALGRLNALGASPVVITTPDLRRYVRAIFERKLPQFSVVSFREIDPLVPLRVAETLKAQELS